MRVAAQIEAEVPVILMRIFGLRLRAQNDLVDDVLVLQALHATQDHIEMRGAQRLALGELDADRREKFRKRRDLFARRFVMGAIDQLLAMLLQGFGRRDIGQDHEFFDQPMRFEPRRNDDAVEGAVFLQQDLALGQIEIERRAQIAGVPQRFMRGVKRSQHRVEQRLRRFIRAALDRVLRLRIGELGVRAHHHAMETMVDLPALAGDAHAHGERRPIFIGAQ